MKFVHRHQQNLPPTEIPVQVSFGATNDSDECYLRGPSAAVEDFTEKIAAFVELEKHDELERGHVTSFDFPQKYANYLIGKKGENINKYREEFDVDIQVKDGKVEITGPKVKADAAKSKILALGKKIEDEAIHVLKIKPQYHREMIGAKGSQVNQLQKKYNVRVQFPRTAAALDDDRSVADDASEVGSVRNRRPNQAPDEVIIRGPKKGADEARDELLNLLQWTMDNSHTSSVSVAQAQLPSLIGQGGREMESIRLQTGAQIEVPGSRESADPNGRVQIQLKGTMKQVENAKKLLEQKVKVFDDSITRSIDIDKRHHRALIGSGGELFTSESQLNTHTHILSVSQARIFVTSLLTLVVRMIEETWPELFAFPHQTQTTTLFASKGLKDWWTRSLLPLKLLPIKGRVKVPRSSKWLPTNTRCSSAVVEMLGELWNRNSKSALTYPNYPHREPHAPKSKSLDSLLMLRRPKLIFWKWSRTKKVKPSTCLANIIKPFRTMGNFSEGLDKITRSL